MNINSLTWRRESEHCDVTLTLSRRECEDLPGNHAAALGMVAMIIESAKAALAQSQTRGNPK